MPEDQLCSLQGCSDFPQVVPTSLLPLSEGVWAWEPRALELLTAGPGDRAGSGLYIRGMPGKNINPCHPEYQRSSWCCQQGRPGGAADPQGGCSAGGTFRERLSTVLPSE